MAEHSKLPWTGHTPTPWAVSIEDASGVDGIGKAVFVRTSDDNDHSAIICRVTPGIVGSSLRWAQEDMVAPKKHLADAALIVRAANNIERLEKIEKAANALLDLPYASDTFAARMSVLRAALSEGPANTEGDRDNG
jgi:hypothetical protein